MLYRIIAHMSAYLCKAENEKVADKSRIESAAIYREHPVFAFSQQK